MASIFQQLRWPHNLTNRHLHKTKVWRCLPPLFHLPSILLLSLSPAATTPFLGEIAPFPKLSQGPQGQANHLTLSLSLSLSSSHWERPWPRLEQSIFLWDFTHWCSQTQSLPPGCYVLVLEPVMWSTFEAGGNKAAIQEGVNTRKGGSGSSLAA